MSDFLNIITDYFQRGYKFEKISPSCSAERAKPVFLIHGWGVRFSTMSDLAHSLADLDYAVFSYDYPSSEHSIAEHAEIFLDLYRKILRTEKIYRKPLFVTHSMGGLLLRAAMAKMSRAECQQIEAVVMLGPPNRGSIWAAIGKNKLAQKVNSSLGDMALDQEAFVNKIPAPAFLPPVGIIAGRRDGKVAFRNTALPEGQPFKRVTVNCTHPGLRDPENTLRHILQFFNRKDFDAFGAEKKDGMKGGGDGSRQS